VAHGLKLSNPLTALLRKPLLLLSTEPLLADLVLNANNQETETSVLSVEVAWRDRKLSQK